MFDFDSLKEINSVIEVRDRKRETQAKKIYEEALVYIKKYKTTNDKEDLIEASNKLFDSVNTYRKLVEPYVWLAYIFQIMEEFDTAMEYLKVAENINPDFPQIIKLKSLISDKCSIDTDINKSDDSYDNIIKQSVEESEIQQSIKNYNPLKVLANRLVNQITTSNLI